MKVEKVPPTPALPDISITLTGEEAVRLKLGLRHVVRTFRNIDAAGSSISNRPFPPNIQDTKVICDAIYTALTNIGIYY